MLVLLLAFNGCSNAAGKNVENDVLSGPSEGVGRSMGFSTKSPMGVSGQTEMPNAEPINSIVICVDPGHGFDDNGTSHENIGTNFEKDITLSVSNKLKDCLTSRGYTVVMTHDGETFPKTSIDNGNNKFSPQERVSYANSIKIDYYVSLHCNSFESNTDVSGVRIFYYEGIDKPSKASAEVAESIRSKIKENYPDDTEPTSEIFNYYVVKYTKVPASLIEMGFVTNKYDAENMLDSEWQDTFAKTVAEGIDDYYKQNPKT